MQHLVSEDDKRFLCELAQHHCSIERDSCNRVLTAFSLQPQHHSRCDDKTESLSLMHITTCSHYIDGDVTMLAAALDIPDEDMSDIKSKYKKVPAQALQMLKKWWSSGTHARQELIEILQSAEFEKAAHM